MSSETDLLPSDVNDLPLIRIASDLSTMAWEQMAAWRGSLGAQLDASVVDTKTSPNDLVTLADAQIESLVRGYLAKVRPGDTMVGEEGAQALDPTDFFDAQFLRRLNCFDPSSNDLLDTSDGSQPLEWHVDPIDGTVNYVRNIEHYAFSVGVCEAGGSHGEGLGEDRWLIGLVASPGLNATWVGVKGRGAYRIEGCLSEAGGSTSAGGPTSPRGSRRGVRARRLRGTPPGLSGRILATGFAYVGDSRGPQLAKLLTLMDGYDDIRRCGSAAIDLCMLAEGKVNSYAERGIGIYDYAGGAVVAEEAGAHVHRGGSGGPTAAAASEQEVRRLIASI
ncbi:inositol monophosphatase family protein [Brevibacterium sp.]|uniref:inositol monophosphatase family protein n=1 Tax=Brevibacterium sp. TaxID=1701 RepID=UPI00264992AD|nr:inositol monophosphatase family protein [Brevibacterium sp.]MDN6135201.1 inositol-phosphate phosphatase [Brevibacterium sp.]MDN6604878.1 inositol-phosphate phosphatase [Brevibacterium sp.]